MTIIEAQQFWICILRYARARMTELKVYTVPASFFEPSPRSPETESDWERKERVENYHAFMSGENASQKQAAAYVADHEDRLTRHFRAATGYLPQRLTGAEEQLGMTVWVLIDKNEDEQPGFIQDDGDEVWLADEPGEECPSPKVPNVLRAQNLPYQGDRFEPIDDIDDLLDSFLNDSLLAPIDDDPSGDHGSPPYVFFHNLSCG